MAFQPFSSRRLQAPMPARSARRGFSFTEILFAVMILGIGFIMVAAMFPVAIHQTEDSSRETAGAALARSAADYVTKVATQTWPLPIPPATTSVAPYSSVLAVTYGAGYAVPTNPTLVSYQPFVVLPGQVWSFNDNRTPATSPFNSASLTGLPAWLWSTVSGNQILPTDPRYAWVAMYKRDAIAPITWIAGSPPTSTIGTASPAPYAQLIMIAVQARSKPAYEPTVDVKHPPVVANLEPVRLTATLARPSNSTILFLSGPMSQAGEGAYVVVSDDTLPATDVKHGILNGRIFRIGVADPSVADKWQLLPGSDLSVSDWTAMGTTPMNVTVLMVGRAVDPATGLPSGVVQDVAAYTTFIQIPN